MFILKTQTTINPLTQPLHHFTPGGCNGHVMQHKLIEVTQQIIVDCTVLGGYPDICAGKKKNIDKKSIFR